MINDPVWWYSHPDLSSMMLLWQALCPRFLTRPTILCDSRFSPNYSLATENSNPTNKHTDTHFHSSKVVLLSGIQYLPTICQDVSLTWLVSKTVVLNRPVKLSCTCWGAGPQEWWHHICPACITTDRWCLELACDTNHCTKYSLSL